MLKKLAVPVMTLSIAVFGCSSSTTPTPGTGGTSGGTAGTSGGTAGHAGGTSGGTAGAAGGAAGHAGGGAAGGLGGAAGSTTQTYSVTLNGPMDMLPTVLGTGTATVTLNTVTGAVTVTGTYTGLTGAATMAHIHGPALPTATAGVLVTLVVTPGTDVTGGTISTMSGAMLTAPQITDMLTGMTYLNIHTAMHTGGEIRGNINTQ